MDKEDFTINPLGYFHKFNPYMYENFKAFNPKLTKRMYEYLRGNGSEWKILCGIGVNMRYENEMLEPIWVLQFINKDIYENRYLPSYYLNMENWKHGND